MTGQRECCGKILSDNRDVTEGEPPYMFRKCLSTDSWNKAECNKNCCTGGRCIATEQGGYCKVNNLETDIKKKIINVINQI